MAARDLGESVELLTVLRFLLPLKVFLRVVNIGILVGGQTLGGLYSSDSVKILALRG